MTFVTDVLNETANSFLGGVSTAAKSALGISTGTIPSNQLLPEYALMISCPEQGIYFKAPLPPEFDWTASAEYDTPMRDTIGDVISSAGIAGRVADLASRANGIQLVTQALTAKFWSGSSTAAITIPVILQAYSDEVTDVLKPLLSLKALTLPKLAGGRRGSVLKAPGPHFDLQKAYNNAKSAVTQGPNNSKSVAGKPTTGGAPSGGVFDQIGRLVSPLTDTVKDVVSGRQSASSAIVEGAYKVGEGVDDYLRASTRNNIIVQIGNYMRLPSVVINDVQQRHLVQPVGSSSLGSSTGNMQRVELSISFQPFFDLTLDDMADVFLDPRVKEYVRSLISAAGGNGTPTDNINGFF